MMSLNTNAFTFQNLSHSLTHNLESIKFSPYPEPELSIIAILRVKRQRFNMFRDHRFSSKFEVPRH